MKYEAKDVSGVATSQVATSGWVSIKQIDARTECAELGPNFRLISNEQWMTMATNVANVNSNWSGNTVGSGHLTRGHSDSSPNARCAASSDDTYAYVETDCTPLNTGTFDQRRTFSLSTGAVLWDIAGNLWELVDYSFALPLTQKPYVAADGGMVNVWKEINTLDTNLTTLPMNRIRPTNSEFSFWNDSWDMSENIGKYLSINTVSTENSDTMARGGQRVDSTRGGIFATDFSRGRYYSNNFFGFRCTMSP